MVDSFADFLGVSTGLALVFIVLIAVQISLQIGSLIHLFTRPGGTVTPNRWVWVVVILLGNGVGAVVYLVLAKSRIKPVDDPLSRSEGPVVAPLTGAQRTVDLLYGTRKTDDR